MKRKPPAGRARRRSLPSNVVVLATYRAEREASSANVLAAHLQALTQPPANPAAGPTARESLRGALLIAGAALAPLLPDNTYGLALRARARAEGDEAIEGFLVQAMALQALTRALEERAHG